MASELTDRWALWHCAFGIALVIFGLIGLFDQSFCSEHCGLVTQRLLTWLYSKFGHWGTSIYVIVVGSVAVVRGLRSNLASKQEE